ncbi:MAG TPA: RHS repeat-associated core domain-containing protein [Rhodocyclaceae bacterium]|nr:PAAR/RHS domain-containing protein [Rhodocyclaceae bacterium]HMV54817.1 RHS repeat-associated core domain-containing protein [Rhodocyclaceae bacterium]HNA03712.1 RHS repeat-associated core domain-containing protein [Rhodocyclaceae bacterium]HNB77522.1 RHS repeat-associated core domain-containing protein [Rhodocyclaceae bacterium]HNC59984.1 RHS repeat-associated core domain-containing protein [Rhodocyclaceae bacterium]
MGGMAAARLGDKIGHVSVWARLARVGLRLAAGMVEALAVGALITLAVGGSVATMGCGAIIAGGLIAGFLGSISGWSDFKERKIKEMTENIGSPDIAGALGQPGSPTVRINARQAMRAIIDGTVCSKHSSNPPPLIAEGSDTVFFDTYPAARKDDKLTCSAKIVEGSDNVLIGRNKAAYLDIADDTEWWEVALEVGIGLLMGRGSFPGRIGCMALGAVAGMAGDALGRGFKSLIGHPVNPATGGKVLDGTDDTDFVLPGPMPIEWKRFYSSNDTRVGSPFGRGWGLPYTVELHVEQRPDGGDALTYVDHQGRKIDMPMVEPGHALFNTAEGITIGRTPGGYFELTTLDHLHYQFDRPPAVPGTHVLKLQRLADRNGNWLRLRYDGDHRLATLTDSLGRILRLRYAGARGNLAAVDLEAPAPDETPGRLVSYQYDANGQLAAVIDRMGETSRWFAYADGVMVKHAYPGGLECHYAWEAPGAGSGPDGDRRVVRHWTSDGETWDIRYEIGVVGGATVATDALGRSDRWTWDGRYNLTGYTNALGQCWKLAWNGRRELTGVTRPDGSQFSFAYDANGLQTLRTDPLGRSTRTQWDERWHEPRKITEPDGGVWQYEYDDKGNLTVETAPDATQTVTAWDNRGLPVLIVDARGGDKRLTWTPRAQLESRTDCSAKTTRYHYDGYGNLARVVDALGQETRLTHDAIGRLITATLADGASLAWQYDAAGRLTGETDALARATRYSLDERGRLTGRTDAAGRRISLGYDRAQRFSRLTTENGEGYDFAYDAADRLVEERRPDGTRLQYEYDANDEVVAVLRHTGCNGDVFDPVDRPVPGPAAGDDTAAGASPRRIELTRDAAGRLIEKRSGSQTVRYRYDKADQLVEAVRLGAGGEPAHSVRFEYDALGRIVAEHATDHASGRTHSLAHEHDLLGNRTRTRLPALAGSAQRHLHYLYYGSGHLHHVRLSLDEGEGLRQQSLWHGIADFERDDLHREILRTQGALTTRYQLDPLGRRLASQAHRGNGLGVLPDNLPGVSTHLPQPGAASLAKRYRYDAAGELREAHHPHKGAASYDYDPTGRLEAVLRSAAGGRNGATPAERFDYDAAGNLLDPAQAEARGYVRDNLVRVFEDKRYAYDGHGRLTEKRSGNHTVQHFAWDDEDRLTRVTTTRRPGTKHETTQTTTFDYDALGRRVAKVDAFGRTEFIWEGLRLIEERRGTRAISYVYEPGSHVPLARIDGNVMAGESEAANDERTAPASSGAAGDESPSGAQLYYFHTDPSGLPEELSDGQGRLRWRAQYRAWGNTLQEHWEATDLDGRPIALDATEQTDALEQNLRYQGQYLDRDTGLHYNTFRYYDPDVGRFISPDPIGLEGGFNLFAYAPNPVIWADPWGLAKEGTYGGERATHVGGEVNHVPAYGSYKNVPKAPTHYSGPAYPMQTADHRAMSSTGSSKNAQAWRARQNALIQQGRWDRAILMDIQDSKMRYGNKYSADMKRMVGAAQRQGLITKSQARTLKGKC